MSDRLALLGGTPSVPDAAPHYPWPIISDATRQAVLRQLDESVSIYDRSGVIARLEDALARYHGVRYALLTSSGTAALHSLFVGAGLEPGDEILCPAYTFHATITPVFQTGAVPVLVDAGPDGNIDMDDLESRVTARTKALIVTHMWGLPCNMAALRDFADRHGLKLLEDGSHAHGARYRGQAVGSFGAGAAFSLQGQKTLTGGEGGFLLTDDEQVYRRALAFGHYNKRCKQEIPPDDMLHAYAITGMGLKLRIHPLAAAIAEQQFEELDTVLAGRRRTAAWMREALADVPGLEMPSVPADVEPAWYAFVMQYQPEALGGLPLERFYEALVAEGCREIDLPRSTAPLNHQRLFQDPGPVFPSYAGRLAYRADQFPGANDFYERAIKLPVWHRDEDQPLVERYVAAIRKVAAHHAELLAPAVR